VNPSTPSALFIVTRRKEEVAFSYVLFVTVEQRSHYVLVYLQIANGIMVMAHLPALVAMNEVTRNKESYCHGLILFTKQENLTV
jgi:predicted membrane-bound spermidine synthase